VSAATAAAGGGAAVTFAVVLPVLLVAHTVADHWVQTDHQASRKGMAGWPGRWACAAHVAGYTATTAAGVAAAWALFGLAITPAGFVVGQVVSAVTHYIADRRTPLAALAARLGKARFYALGAPRAGRDDNPSLGTGAYALDQSWHHAWLLAAAATTALL
jgi:hypothetical protein